MHAGALGKVLSQSHCCTAGQWVVTGCLRTEQGLKDGCGWKIVD